METHCPHCRSTVRLDFEREVRTDGGTEAVIPDGLRGDQRCCGDCGKVFSVYVY